MSGSLILALPVALVAGLVSFLQPLRDPVAAGYLSYASGISGAELEGRPPQPARGGRVLFVLGFATVFVLLGSLTGAAGAWLFVHYQQLNVVLGIVTILLGIASSADRIPPSATGASTRSRRSAIAAAPLLGFLFGVGLDAVRGTALAAINVLSLNEATATRGAVLSGVFALGLGLPFIAAAVAYRRMLGAFKAVRRHQVLIMRLGGR